MILSDFYKLNHQEQYPPGTNKIYSYLEARGSREDGLDYTVFFGLQYYLKKYLAQPITKGDVDAFAETLGAMGIPRTDRCLKKFYELAELGYLPIKIKAVPEGTVMPLKNVLMTITNTEPEFYWLVNYLETLLMKVWLPITVASNSYRFRRMFNGYADRTVGNRNHVPFQMHDFGYRGCGSEESAAIAGAAHLTSFLGTDTIAAVKMLKEYYHGGKDGKPVGLSVPASEHSVMCAWSEDNEDKEAIKNMLDLYPSGIVSIVSDTYNLWKTITDYYGRDFKEQIMARNGKTVVRPDSSDPVLICCGNPSADTIEEQFGVVRLLDRYFGSSWNEKGYREVDSHVGTIYGDGIFYNRAQEILSKLAGMGYAANNIVFGSGGLLLNQFSRDTLGMAIKATYCEVEGKPRPIEKNPITDKGKKSKKGLLALTKEVTDAGLTFRTLADCTPEQEAGGELQTVFENGNLLVDESITTIRDRLVANS